MTQLPDIKDIFITIESLLSSDMFLLLIVTAAFFMKCYLVIKILSNKPKAHKIPVPLLLLLVVLISIMFADSSWIFKMGRILFFPFINYKYLIFWARINIGIGFIQYHALALFLESLIYKKKIIAFKQKIFIPITTILSSFFFILAFLQFNHPYNRPFWEFKIMQIGFIYQLYALLFLSVIDTLFTLKREKIPVILKKQMKVFIWALMIPNLIAELIHFYPFNVLHNFMNHQHTFISLSAIIITFAIYYCIKKVIGLRFLNMKHTLKSTQFIFLHDFKNIVAQLGQVTDKKELQHITQTFFEETFGIPKSKTRLFMRKVNAPNRSNATLSEMESSIETFLNAHSNGCNIETCFNKSKIIVKDDLEFSNYYEDDTNIKKIILFLESINVALFLPIHGKDGIIAYILVEQYARLYNFKKRSELYSTVEQDQMIVFSSYLGNIIKLLQQRNLKTIIKKEKELEQELYSKHQEINQYKESVRSFINYNKEKKIGIIFYRNNRFIFGNQIAKKLIPIHINKHDNHPIKKALIKIIQQVLTYQSPRKCMLTEGLEKRVVVYGIRDIERNEVIITVHHPEISDILSRHVDILKDPTKWDYLLYLETTESGKLINDLIPGNEQQLLNFKISLLKIALSKKAIFLDIPENDLLPTVELLHHISLREKLYILNLRKPTKNFDIAIQLFGINPLFENGKTITPLLEKLNNKGTLFIKNIHFLDKETQKQLSQFMKCGLYKQVKGHMTTSSNVRIISSSYSKLNTAFADGILEKNLFEELKKSSISMPPLGTLTENELEKVTIGFVQQAIKEKEFKHIFELTEAEKRKIFSAKPASFAELKIKIAQLLEKKSKEHSIYEEKQYYSSCDTTDPHIIEAARLGKKALKNPQLMGLLWNTFRNQNKIATILGVNRSSVNRRCKEYDLM